MIITTILGSPRKNGNTATVLKAFEGLAKSRYQIDRINITDFSISGCLGCNVCYKHPDEPGCIQKDDAVLILNRLIKSDVIVYSTPLYVWSFSAQMKALIDRHYCLVKWKNGEIAGALLQGKRAALLVTCGDPIENNADLIPVIFDRQMKYLKCEVIGKYIVPNCSRPSLLGDRALTKAQELYNDIKII